MKPIYKVSIFTIAALLLGCSDSQDNKNLAQLAQDRGLVLSKCVQRSTSHDSKIAKLYKSNKIIHLDTVAPVLSFEGDNPLLLSVGDTYTRECALGIDANDGQVDVFIVDDHVDTSVVTTYTVLYSAVDRAGNVAELNRTIQIVSSTGATNTPPTLDTAILDQNNNDADTVNLNVSGNFSDIDNDPLTFSATGLPTGLSIHPTTGIISGTLATNASVSSPYAVTINVTDGNASVTAPFNMLVSNTITPTYGQDFIITVNTANLSSGSTTGTEFKIPTNSSHTYNYNVDCNNDGMYEHLGVTGDQVCSYTAEGNYTIAIQDNIGDGTGFPRIYFNGGGDKLKLTGISQWGDGKWISMESAFWGCANLSSASGSAPDLSNVTSLSVMFNKATSFNQNISDWNTSNIEKMDGMFANTTVFNQPLGNWDVSNVTTMNAMFSSASSFDQNISGWNTASVTDMSHMFSKAFAFNQDLGNWNTSSVTLMTGMFETATSFNGSVENWDTSNVTNMNIMFLQAYSFSGHSLCSWSVSNVTTHSSMFSGAGVGNTEPSWPGTLTLNNITNANHLENSAYNSSTPVSSTTCPLNYTLSGVDASLFDINVSTGVVSMVARDYESPQDDGGDNVYEVHITATDAGNSAIEDWNVTITDINEAHTINTSTTTPSMPENQTSAIGLNVSDPEGSIPPWSLSGVDAGLFHLVGTGSSVILTFNTAPDFEAPTDSGLDNIYNVTVSSSDGTNTATKELNITVTDVNETVSFLVTPFVITVKTDNIGNSTNTQFKINTYSGFPAEDYNYSVDCDYSGTFTATVTGQTGVYTCDYGTGNEGDYTIAIKDDIGDGTGFPRVHFANSSSNDVLKLTGINAWGNGKWTSMANAFSGCQKLGNLNAATDAPDLSNVTDMRYMFQYAYYFDQDISSWNVSHVNDMTAMFDGAQNFNQPLNSWNTSNVTSMAEMFNVAKKFNQSINDWNTSQVTNMDSMFAHANEFNQSVANWDTSHVEDMNHMFYEAHTFNHDISIWDTSSVTDMSYMFYRAYAFNQNISIWDTSSVTDMSYMFQEASLFNQPIGSNWDTSNVTNMSWMFYAANNFNQSLAGWATSSITNMTGMFHSASSFNQDISMWNVSNVESMTSMFRGASSFNQPIGNWDTSSVTKMGEMFQNATSFNQPLDFNTTNTDFMKSMFRGASSFNQPLNFDTSNVTTMSYMFQNATSFDNAITFDTSNVNDMTHMFQGASSFNHAINFNTSMLVSTDAMFRNAASFDNAVTFNDTSNVITMKLMFAGASLFNHAIDFDTSSVTTMQQMFDGASVFDQNISTWDTSSVTNMNYMFKNTINFNQDIGDWNTSSVLSMASIFNNANTFNQDIGAWDTHNVLTMEAMFLNAAAFNQDLSTWDTSSVHVMYQMFQNANSFSNHDLYFWNVSSVTNHTSFMTGAGTGNTEPMWP